MIVKVSSFFGLAPLRFKPIDNGYVVSLSIPMCIYSYLLITFVVCMVYFCIISEIQLGVNPYFHNSSRLSQAMSFCDLSFLAIMGSAGVYGAPARMRSMIKFMRTIAAVDKAIGLRCSRAKKRFCICFFLFMIFLIIITLGDIPFTVLRAPPDRQWSLVLHYFGFYFIWYFVVILEVQFTVTAMMVYVRFKTLTETLSLTAKHLIKPNLVMEPRRQISPTDAVHRFSLLYSKLCDVVRHLENSYSSCLVIILVSTLFHLIITLYFTILEINVKVSGSLYPFILLQTVWFSLHTLRLLMVVEPCHYTTRERERTERLVCDMMLASPAKGALAFQLELLSRQLMLQPVCYKPLGACTLGRPLIASIYGAVTTYLVILIQFQKYEY